jgi:enoyl-CoA hydratase/carnithine racemase
MPRLVRELGPAVAKELVLTCRPFDAAEAHAWRFVNTVVEPDVLFDHVDALAAVLAAKPRLGVLATTQQARIASEDLVATRHSDVDHVLLAAAAADPESRAVAAARNEALRAAAQARHAGRAASPPR